MDNVYGTKTQTVFDPRRESVVFVLFRCRKIKNTVHKVVLCAWWFKWGQLITLINALAENNGFYITYIYIFLMLVNKNR